MLRATLARAPFAYPGTRAWPRLPRPRCLEPGRRRGAERVDRYGAIGVALTVLGCVLQAGGLIARGLAAHRPPWGNMYEFALSGSLGAAVTYLVLLRRLRLRWLGLFMSGLLVVVLMVTGLLLYVPAGPLVPVLHSYWLLIHVTAAIDATGAFAVGALSSVLYLVKRRAEDRAEVRAEATPATTTADTPDLYRSLARLSSSAVLDRISYRIHAFAFPIWTFAALIAGPIWAQYAWGRYWGWDPKEIWAFITWVVYAGYLHARATAGWRGNKAATIALVGFGTVLFNFVGINLFGSGLHSYSGM